MESAPLPEDETRRLEALRRTRLLDTPPEPDFDELAELASMICGTPVALVSLVDGRRQWFKAKVGLDAEETPRDVAFCAHAILEPERTFAVPDARRDPRFADNPLVTGPPSVRAYFGRPLRTADGSAIGTLCVIDHEPRDLTDDQRRALEILARRVETEIALRAGRDAAVAAERVKSNFLATMSHEIRTPLNGLLGTLELVLDEALPQEQRGDLEAALGSARLLRTLLDSVLDLSKAENSELELHPSAVELRPLLEGLVASFGAGARLRGNALEVQVGSEVPPRVEVDEARLAQVLGNLLGNAVKFTDGGRIAVRVEGRGPRLRFEVSDTGVGIAAEDLDRVLEPFGQAGDGAGGTGLGLSLARDLVRLMGGELELDSAPGRGTTVAFELALEQVDDPGRGGLDADAPLVGRVLLVDDDALNLAVGRRTLERLGLEVETAGGGEEALARLAAEGFDAVLLDQQMDDLDGHEVAERVRATLPGGAELPLIGLTAGATTEVRELCLGAGMNEVLQKPIDRRALAAALRRWIGLDAIDTR